MAKKFQVLILTLLCLRGSICAENAWSYSNGVLNYNGDLAKIVAKTTVMACVNYGKGVSADPDPDPPGSGNGPSPDDDYQVAPS